MIRFLLLGTACGLCFFAQAAAAAQAIDTAKLENGFTAGCLRQDTDCFFQHVQWRSSQSTLDMQNKSQWHERFRYEMGLNLATGEFGVIR